MVYYYHMQFATAQEAIIPKQLSVKLVSLILAFLIVIAALLQLFSFEDYPAIVESYIEPLFGVAGLGLPLAALIVALEILAIPHLLWMKLSPLMYYVSKVSCWTVLVYWFFVGVWQVAGDLVNNSAGLFGPKILVPQGWWLVGYSLILIVMMSYLELSYRRAKSVR